MPMAQSNTAGFAPATWGGATITEIGPAQRALTDADCHFGVNANPLQKATLKTLLPGDKKKLAKYGPRSLDMAVRGGIVAESIWEEYQSGSSPHSAALQKFLITFDDVGGKKAVSPGKDVYPKGAMISGTDVGDAQKYGGANKSIASLNKAFDTTTDDDATGLQFGTRWSKISLESAVLNGGNIIFHLDGMGNVKEICDKQGDYGYNVTSRELRYVKRNWGRLASYTRFFNGFYVNGSSVLTAVMVKAPWE